MKKFAIWVLEWYVDPSHHPYGTPREVAVHIVEAESPEAAMVRVAHDYCDCRLGYNPADPRPYVSCEGWREVE